MNKTLSDEIVGYGNAKRVYVKDVKQFIKEDVIRLIELGMEGNSLIFAIKERAGDKLI